ncbi:MAG: SRPBCC family protein [Chloroflexota bacterium]|nr:SRPBCC family protein [Chloroflexota bacterium]
MAFPLTLSTWTTTPLSTGTDDEIRERDPELHYETEYEDGDGLHDGTSTRSRSTGWPIRLLSAGVSLVAVDLVYRKLTGHHILYQSVSAPERSNGHEEEEAPSPIPAHGVQRTLTIGATPDALYRLWQQPETLSRVMGHVGEVTANADGSHHWVIPGPLGQTLVWDTRVVMERPGELIRWEAVTGGPISSAGEIRFRPGPPDWGTETTLHITVSLPWGIPGEGAVLKLMNPAPQLLLGQALRRFKSLAETGEIPTLHDQPAFRDSGRDT